MRSDQIDLILRAAGGSVPTTQLEDALRSIAGLSVSVLRMIDSRRERGVDFDDSYNEDELRRALASLADQTFPPGPPMTPVRSSVLDEIHDFQRFEHRTRGLDGRTTRQLKIVCRCGWSASWIDREPDGDVALSAARVQLQDHVGDAIWLAKRNA